MKVGQIGPTFLVPEKTVIFLGSKLTYETYVDEYGGLLHASDKRSCQLL